MVYIEYSSLIDPKEIIEIVRKVHYKHPELKYIEMLDKLPSTKYLLYRDTVVIGGIHVRSGKYASYDKVSGTSVVAPLFQVRFNPNKYCDESWFQELLKQLLKNALSGTLQKYDYSVDIPKMPQFVEVLNTRKEKGLYKNSRYYGQTGRHGFLKIYDKQKEQEKVRDFIGPLTRVEHTLFTKEKPSLEDVYVFDDTGLDVDYSKLKDTEKAIVEMYLQLKALGYKYDLKLGRKMQTKLAPYLSGSYVKLEYGDILDRLIDNIKKEFRCYGTAKQEALPVDGDGFILTDDYLQMELEELFGG